VNTLLIEYIAIAALTRTISSCHRETALKAQKLPHTDWTNVLLRRQ